jgi:hypothetical protein
MHTDPRYPPRCAVMWNDLELYHHYRDFTLDPVTFPAREMRDFIRSLVRRPVLLARLRPVSLTFLYRGRTNSTV